jgi:hypothetical protein
MYQQHQYAQTQHQDSIGPARGGALCSASPPVSARPGTRQPALMSCPGCETESGSKRDSSNPSGHGGHSSVSGASASGSAHGAATVTGQARDAATGLDELPRLRNRERQPRHHSPRAGPIESWCCVPADQQECTSETARTRADTADTRPSVARRRPAVRTARRSYLQFLEDVFAPVLAGGEQARGRARLDGMWCSLWPLVATESTAGPSRSTGVHKRDSSNPSGHGGHSSVSGAWRMCSLQFLRVVNKLVVELALTVCGAPSGRW